MRKYIAKKSIMSVSLVLLILHIFCPAAARAVLKGGCAKVNITPPLGIPLIGSYGKPSDDVLDELYAKALVLNDGNNTIAIVSTDLLYTPLEEITNPVREIIKDKLSIPEQNVLICATHTHSGPEVFARTKLPREGRLPASQIDQSYLATLVKKIASSVLMAHKKMAAVRIGAAKGQIPEIVYNRRTKTKDGAVKMAFTLPPDQAESVLRSTTKDELVFGPIDPDVWVLRVEDANGQSIGSIVNFACHPVCIYPSLSTTISADYPGYATQVVEEIEGGTCLFTLGTAGDIVPIKRGLKPCQQIGKALGAEALRRLQLVPTSGDVSLKAIRKEIKLPTKRPASADKTADDSKNAGYINTEVQLLKLGNIYLLGLPGEILVEVGLEIKKRARLENLFVVSLSNDAVGYVCHSQTYDEGGYESGSGTSLAKGAGETMIEQALDLIEQIKQSP